MDWPTDQLINWCIGWWINGSMVRWFDGSMVRWFDGLTVLWFDGSMVWWFDGSIDWRPCRRYRYLDRVCVCDREWGFLHCWWKVNTFRDIVDGLQRKCKRKRLFLFYPFLWTCRETSKSKALEIVYRAYVGRLGGGRWNEKCQLGRCTNQRWDAQAQNHVIALWFVDISEFFPDTSVFYD